VPIDEEQTLAKVARRLIPFMIFLYLLNYLDRSNIASAMLQMKPQLNMNNIHYSNAIASFYVGYCLFEVPSNLIMVRVGARVWIARIMISWGIVSTLMMFIQGPWSFYVLRLLLGIAEAGFFPGMILYLTYWVPHRMRARTAAWFLTSTAASGVIGNPLAGFLITLGAEPGAMPVTGTFAAVQNLTGWQLLFLIEGVVTVLVGIFVLFYLTDKPEHAKWLSPDERTWLSKHIEAENSGGAHEHTSLRPAFTDPKVWILCFVYSGVLMGFYCIVYWTPMIIKEHIANCSDARASTLAAIPFVGAVIGMLLFGRSSDLSGERPRHVALSCLTGSIGLLLACLCISSPWLLIAALSIAAAGAFGSLGPFWAMPSEFLRGAAAAAGIAVINSVGNFAGGFIGPKIIGAVKESTQSYAVGLLIIAGALFAGSIVSLLWLKQSSPAPTITTSTASPASSVE
jgi:ACS family tartrate transporter-like MFS transporter